MKKEVALSIGNAKRMSVHLRIHMPIRHEYVYPAIVVVVEEFHAKAKKRNADRPEPGGSGLIREAAVVVVVVEVVGIVGKVSFHQVRPAVIVVIGAVHPHAGLGQAISAESHSSLHSYFRKPSFAVVVVKAAGAGIVGNIEVEAAVLVVVQPNDAQAIIGLGINAQLFAYVGEGAVAVIVVQPITRAIQASRPAGNGYATVLAERTTAEGRQVVQVEFHIVSDIEIQAAIIVVIAEGSARAPAAGIVHARLGSYIGESSVAVIVVKHAAIEVGDVDILIAVVVIIAYGHAETPATVIQTGFGTNVAKGAIVVVAVKRHTMAAFGAQIGESGAVHQQDVHPAVVVVIKNRHAAAHGFHDVELLRPAAGEVEIDAGCASYVFEGDSGGRFCSAGAPARGFCSVCGAGALARGLCAFQTEVSSGCSYEERQPQPAEEPHQCTPEAMPPVCGCCLRSCWKSCSSELAPAVSPVRRSARESW